MRPSPALATPMTAAVCPVSASVPHRRVGSAGVGDAEEQAAAGLGVGEQQLRGLVVIAGIERRADVIEVPARPAGQDPVGEQLADAVEHRHRVDVDRHVDPRLGGHAAEVAEQPEAGDVGAAGGAGGQGGVAGLGVEAGHRRHGRLDQRGRGHVGLDGGGGDADAERLGQHEDVAGAESGVGEDPVGMDLAHHRHAVLRLGIVDGVAAGHDEAGLGGYGGTALEHLGQQVGGQLVDVPAHQVEGEQRRAAHGVDVGDGVGRGHPPPGAGVVDHGRDEVGGDHQGALVREAPHGGIVAGERPDQQVWSVR